MICVKKLTFCNSASAGELRDGQIVKMIISGRNWRRLAFFLKGQDYLFVMNHFCIYTSLFQETKNITKKIDQTFTRQCLDWVGLGGNYG